MPELPEVETVKRGLSGELDFGNVSVSKILRSAKALRVGPDPKMCLEVRGQKILSLDRKAKYLLFHLEDYVLLSHLGMTGSWRFEKGKEKHDHIRIFLSDGRVMTYQDPRRFGMFEILEKSQWDKSPRLSILGIDPVLDKSFNGSYLWSLFHKSQTTVKVAIMNQKFLVGVGNIYASEALYLAGIHPAKLCSQLEMNDWNLLASAIKQVLFEAIDLGGSSIKNFKKADGDRGYFQNLHLVYGKDGHSCRFCQTPIKSQAIVGRNSFWCPQCQKL